MRVNSPTMNCDATGVLGVSRDHLHLRRDLEGERGRLRFGLGFRFRLGRFRFRGFRICRFVFPVCRGNNSRRWRSDRLQVHVVHPRLRVLDLLAAVIKENESQSDANEKQPKRADRADRIAVKEFSHGPPPLATV